MAEGRDSQNFLDKIFKIFVTSDLKILRFFKIFLILILFFEAYIIKGK